MRGTIPFALITLLALPAAAKPTMSQIQAIGAHASVNQFYGPLGVGTVFLVHASADGRTALALTAAHGDPRTGDPVRFQSPAGSVDGSVTRVIAQSTRLDYSLVTVQLSKPIRTSPLPVVGDKLPQAGAVTSLGWTTTPSRMMTIRYEEGRMARRPGIGRVPYPDGPLRGARDSVPAAVLNPLLMFSPYGGMPVNVTPGREPKVRRVTVAAFDLPGEAGMSGGPILDGMGRVVALISGGGKSPAGWVTAGVPAALIVRDVARRIDGLFGESKTLVRDWLKTVPHKIRGRAPAVRTRHQPAQAWASPADRRSSGLPRASRWSR